MSDSTPRPIAIKSPSPPATLDTHSIAPSSGTSASSSTMASVPSATPSISGHAVSRLLPLANDHNHHHNLHNQLQQTADLTKNVPITICTSKKWVLPPRPKPGRKPSSANNNNNNNINNNSNGNSSADSGAKRKNQNRAAQKAYRERKAAERKMIEQESKSALCNPSSANSSSTNSNSATAAPTSTSNTTAVSTPTSNSSSATLSPDSSITNTSISTSIFIDQQLQTKNQEIASLNDVVKSLRAEIRELKKQQFCPTCNSNLKSNPFLFDEIEGTTLPQQQLTIVPLKKRPRNNSGGASIFPQFKKLTEIDFNTPPYSSHSSTITPISPESDIDDDDEAFDDLNDLNDSNMNSSNSLLAKKRKKRIKKKRIDPCGFCSNGTPCLCEEAALQAFEEDGVDLIMTI